MTIASRVLLDKITSNTLYISICESMRTDQQKYVCLKFYVDIFSISLKRTVRIIYIVTICIYSFIIYIISPLINHFLKLEYGILVWHQGQQEKEKLLEFGDLVFSNVYTRFARPIRFLAYQISYSQILLFYSSVCREKIKASYISRLVIFMSYHMIDIYILIYIFSIFFFTFIQMSCFNCISIIMM